MFVTRLGKKVYLTKEFPKTSLIIKDAILASEVYYNQVQHFIIPMFPQFGTRWTIHTPNCDVVIEYLEVINETDTI